MESTLKPAEVAVYMVKSAVAKHADRYENVFFKAVRLSHMFLDSIMSLSIGVQVLAGVMLSFGGLLSEIVSGGSAGLNTDNPGLVKLLSGFVFPVGLVMYVEVLNSSIRVEADFCVRIVLQGQELVTSNMMVHRYSCPISVDSRTDIFLVGVPHGCHQGGRAVVESPAELAHWYRFSWFTCGFPLLI